ncbi:zinc finger protein 831 isoform X2 [Eleginops maclovinus]|uniref:zinc finger protein 831 isoform X2 n=1 Tax=Eleginops maclovinus TaxID=56733 RepID=UPI003080FA15
METGKPGLQSASVHISTVAEQTEGRMDLQAPLTAVYIQAVPPSPAQPPAAPREPATLHVAMPPLYSKKTLPFLTLHITGGLQCQPGLSLTAAAPAARPKTSGKHVCSHCGRDCMKPSVLEKHLRCHTGERPYPCTTCGVSFKTQSNLYKHKRTQAHARLWSESEQSSMSSLDSMSDSRETCTSSLSLDEHSGESSIMEKGTNVSKDATLPAETNSPASTAKVFSVQTHGSVGVQNTMTHAGQKMEENECAKVTIKKQRREDEKPPLTASRHLPLQRQEATLFSKQWENSVSRGKSQSHESTDSGFSESSEHYPSPGSLLPDHSVDSFTESTKEYPKHTTTTNTTLGPGQAGQEHKYIARKQKSLEEHISKLISENKAVVEDKQLENVRPRKTVLSQQGSIDLPMPYTYKDSFHFDMRISKTPNVGLQRHTKPDFYTSVPTQRSNTVEHAPLTRSHSLPFSVALLQPDRSSPTSCYQNDYVRIVRRESSGQITPTFVQPVKQPSSTHRPLVRQTAVDGNHATDTLFTNPSVEEASTGSRSCDGDGGDICGEPSNRKFRRKKAQKFAYNKWYMYGGGTFKKLYNAEKGGDDSVIKGRKCSTNPEQEVERRLPNSLSAVHMETVTITDSTINLPNSSAAACRSGCSTAGTPVFAKGLNIKTSQLHTSCSSLRTPLRRNLSLSVLPVSSIGPLGSHQTDSMSKAEAGKMIDAEKHFDFLNIIPDRKKKKTDGKIIGLLEMETKPNTQILSSISSAPQQNLCCMNPPKNLKHMPLKAALLPTCIINANTLSVSTSLADPPTAKASFLPKYQLKLPHDSESGAVSSQNGVDKTTGSDGCAFNSVLSPYQSEQSFPSFKERKSGDPVITKQTCDVKKTNPVSSTQDQIPTTLSQAETRLNPTETVRLSIAQGQFSSTTTTTTGRQIYQAGLFSTSIQSSKSTGGSGPVPGPVAPKVANFSSTPTLTIAHNQSSPAAITELTQSQANLPLPLSHTQLLPASEHFSSVNSAYGGSNRPAVPCHMVPFNQMRPDDQNVFHVHTADLQICLQIISDEQLALIEPQIERQSVNVLSQRCDVEATLPEMSQKNPLNFDLEKSESLPTLHMEKTKPPAPVQFVKAELTEQQYLSQATPSAECTHPEALSPSQLPHLSDTVTATQSSAGNVMPTAASLSDVKSGRGQSSEEQHSLSVNCCAEEQWRLGRGALTSQTRTERLVKERQIMLNNQAGNVGTIKAVEDASAYESSKLDSGRIHRPLQASAAACADQLSGSSSSINKCKSSRQLKPQAFINCSNPVQTTLSETLPQKSVLSQDVSSSTHSEKPLAQFVPVPFSIQVERPEDVPAVLRRNQSPAAGLMEKEPPTLGPRESTKQGGSLQGRGGARQSGETKRDQTKSHCTHTSSADKTKPEKT